MKTGKRLLAIILTLVLCVTMTSSAFAANECILVKGSSTKTAKFYVETGNSTSGKLTFTQTKGKISYDNDASGTSKANMYGAYTVRVKYINSKGQTCYQIYNWEYSKSITIKLDQKNELYLIEVIPYSVSKVGARLRQTNVEVRLRTMIQYAGGKRDFDYAWSESATWTVKGSNYVTWCYQR